MLIMKRFGSLARYRAQVAAMRLRFPEYKDCMSGPSLIDRLHRQSFPRAEYHLRPMQKAHRR